MVQSQVYEKAGYKSVSGVMCQVGYRHGKINDKVLMSALCYSNHAVVAGKPNKALKLTSNTWHFCFAKSICHMFPAALAQRYV